MNTLFGTEILSLSLQCSSHNGVDVVLHNCYIVRSTSEMHLKVSGYFCQGTVLEDIYFLA